MATVTWPAELSPAQRRDVVSCARWSRLAYTAVPESSKTLNVTRVVCDGCDAHCFVFEEDGTLVITVRGTASAEDMLCDVRVVQSLLEDIPDVLVHAGFNLQFKALSRIVNQRVIAHLVRGGKLICTGHSLGAGVAALFAVSYGIRFPQKVSYYGFGSPRQGNVVFMELMRSTTSLAVIVKNLRDPVCACIPAICLPQRYEHAGLPVLIGRDPDPELPDLLYVGDHDIAKYVQNLEDSINHRSPAKKHSVCSIT